MQLIWFIFPTTIYLCLSYIRLNFASIKSFISSKDLIVRNSINQENNTSVFYVYVLKLLTLSLIILASYSTQPDSILFLNKTNLLIIASLGLALICFKFFNLQQVNHNLFYAIATIFTLISALITLTSNLYQMYLILEILAYTNLLFISAYRGTTSRGGGHLVTSLVVSFILNFVASIILFTAFTMIIWEFAYPTWWVLGNTNPSFLVQLMLTISILIKLGTGPWLSGNVTAYSGYSLEYLIVYTLSSVLLIAPTLLNLFSSPNLVISITTVLSLVLYISQTGTNVNSIKSLFAYSTVIMLLYVILILIV